jgi:chromosome partitioning protein
MRRIAIINQKGGVGKTTTTVNLAAALARQGQRVCVLDLDPQAHATTHLGLEPDGKSPSMYDVPSTPSARRGARKVGDNLWVAGSDINLAAAEVELAGVVGREVILRDLLQQEEGEFDFVFMDCAPSLGVLTLNALAAANEVFIPLQPHFLALHGMGKLLETTALVAKRINPSLQVTGVVLCLYEATTKLAQEVVKDLTEYFEKGARACPGPGASSARAFAATSSWRSARVSGSRSSATPEEPRRDDHAALAREVRRGHADRAVSPRRVDARGQPTVLTVEQQPPPAAVEEVPIKAAS